MIASLQVLSISIPANDPAIHPVGAIQPVNATYSTVCATKSVDPIEPVNTT